MAFWIHRDGRSSVINIAFSHHPAPRGVKIRNQFDEFGLRVRASILLCVPSTKLAWNEQ